MAQPGLIAAYLNELRYSVAKLEDGDEILIEVTDHLMTAVDALVAAGRKRTDAEAEALARFGSAALVSRVFIEEARRGGAVSTRLTRLAGLAAMCLPVFAVVGQIGNQTIDTGFMHGAAVAVLTTGLPLFAFALWGLRRRHGGLGPWGRAAFWLFLASPILSAPFAWGAGVAFFFVQLIVVALLAIGMLRARVLPRAPVAMFAAGPATALVAVALFTAGGRVPGVLTMAAAGICTTVGLAWLGFVMWREPALDMNTGGTGPFATV